MALGFLVRIILVRSLTQSEYGVYSLGLVIVNILVALSLFGFQDGIPRQIGYYNNNYNQKIQQIIRSSLIIVGVLSTLAAIILFSFSNFISIEVFHSEELYSPLRIYAVSIPFLALTQLFLSIFRGFGKVKENIIFSSIAINAIFLCIALIIIEHQASYIYIILGYTISSIIAFLLLLAYSYFANNFASYYSKSYISDKSCQRELLIFCLPLFGAYLLAQLMGWMDILMLGYFTNTERVGLYSAALPVAQIVSNLFYASHFLIIPLVAQLYSQSKFGEIKENYKIISKWLLIALAPISIILISFPNKILTVLYGSSYNESAFVLQVFSIGYLILAIFGPSGAVLLGLGKSRYILKTAIIGTIINIFLNAILIPALDIRGAAIASVVALVTVHLFYSSKLYYSYAIHPFDRNYLVFVSSLMFIIIILNKILDYIVIDSIIGVCSTFILIIIICILILISTDNIKDVDKEIMRNVINRFKSIN